MFNLEDRSQEVQLDTDAVNNQFEWTIPFDPFYINSKPNDRSYLTEFSVDNDESTSYIEEDSRNSVPNDYNRYAYVEAGTENQPIHYVGFGSYETGGTRIDKFLISAFVGKDETQSRLSMRVPYKARLEKWTGSGDPVNDDGTIRADHWTAMTYDASEENQDYNKRRCPPSLACRLGRCFCLRQRCPPDTRTLYRRRGTYVRRWRVKIPHRRPQELKLPDVC